MPSLNASTQYGSNLFVQKIEQKDFARYAQITRGWAEMALTEFIDRIYDLDSFDDHENKFLDSHQISLIVSVFFKNHKNAHSYSLSNQEAYVCKEDNKSLGIIILHHTCAEIEVLYLISHPLNLGSRRKECRSYTCVKKIGEILLKKIAFRNALQNNSTVYVYPRPGAISFYSKMGFKQHDSHHDALSGLDAALTIDPKTIQSFKDVDFA